MLEIARYEWKQSKHETITVNSSITRSPKINKGISFSHTGMLKPY
jgi:hypothetical protein